MDAFRIIRRGLFREVRGPVYGRQDLGYSPGGPMDRFSMQTGNIILGNDDFAPALEVIYSPVLEFEMDCLFVLTGAGRRNTRLLRTSAGRELSAETPHGVVACARKRDRIVFGETEYGFRTYLCFAPCDAEALGRKSSLLGRSKPPYREMSAWADPDNRIRVMEGPEYRRLKNPSAFLDQSWRTTAEMSDMGIRLASPGSERPVVESEDMVSQPVNDGAIQFTPQGPIVLLRERQTIGGYPRVFNVIGPDVDLLAQYGPHQVIRFRRASLEESLAAVKTKKQVLDRFRLLWADGAG